MQNKKKGKQIKKQDKKHKNKNKQGTKHSKNSMCFYIKLLLRESLRILNKRKK